MFLIDKIQVLFYIYYTLLFSIKNNAALEYHERKIILKKLITFFLVCTMLFSLAACSSDTENGKNDTLQSPAVSSEPSEDVTPEVSSEPTNEPTSEPIELIVFAAASMTETMNTIAEMYKEVAPYVTIVYNFDSSGTLKTQIQEGADCDIFISAGQLQMNQIDINGGEDNTENLDFVIEDTRFDIVKNTCVICVPEGNPAGITSFEDVNTDKVSLIALGNSDVPVGQYSEEIFTTLGFWNDIQDKITFGSNVKEVTTQVAEAAVDCGVVYATDAYSAGLEWVAVAGDDLCQPPVYPAAVLNITKNEQAARDFLEYLKTDECSTVFESVGFAIP